MEIATLNMPDAGALEAYGGGLLVNGLLGFWDLPNGGTPTWIDLPEDGSPRQFLVGDLDRDGTADVITVGEATRSFDVAGDPVAESVPQLVVWQRAAGALLQRAAIDPGGGGDEASALAFGDVDQDETPDLVTIQLGTPILLRGDGSFGFTREEAGPRIDLSRANSVLLGVDLYDGDDDGDLDLVGVHDNYQNGVLEVFTTFWPGDGRGGFGAATIGVIDGAPSTNSRPITPFADVTGDGLADIVFQVEIDGTSGIHVASGRAGGQFDAAERIFEPAWQVELVHADTDGVLDILAMDRNEITVLRARGGLDFEPQHHSVAAGNARAMAASDATQAAAARLHFVLQLDCQPACTASCSGFCLFGVCMPCGSDSDCVAREDDAGVSDADSGA